jgi:hypothetical protein
MMRQLPGRRALGSPGRALGVAAPPSASPPEISNEGLVATSTSFLEKLAPVASELLNTTAVEDVAVLKAKIRNNEELRDKFPEPLKTYYRNEVRKLKAKLTAKQEAAKEERITTQSKREWANLGKAAVVVGILVGVAVVGGIIKRTA